ncbi:flagellar basal-body protein FlbY [Brevundimonas fluminis]|jgi:O6-methylguanine-DNA--protein-cysteine methyltransferase|uniref:flagellar basal-body protein FlbY n=1 Tax=Brevundimonas fluminis TaxID=2487274 RepID=UPI000F656BEB|nr:flagellar basal-body protein FlbY [Brevundimonas fluminis]
MSADPQTAAFHVRRLIDLTRRLTGRLETETEAFREHRARDLLAGQAETQEMANVYRRESAQLKARPDVLKAATVADRMELVHATELFEVALSAHSRVVEAARTVSEGLVRTIAAEVAAQRGNPSAYGAAGHANAPNATAVALNRTA